MSSRRSERVRSTARSEGTTARLINHAIRSLDGYVADRDGRFDRAEPDEEVQTFLNDPEERREV